MDKTEVFVNTAKKVMEVNGGHKPMFIFDGHINLFIFKDDKEKLAMLKAFRDMVKKKNIQEYWFIMETWVGKNVNVRPMNDPERTEAMVINHYKKDMTLKSIMLPFVRENNKIVWGERSEIDQKDTLADRWNLFVEDVTDEKIDKETKPYKHYCEKCQKPVMVSGGGTYCRYHQQELCRTITRHCHSCGVWMCECGGSYRLDDGAWKSRKWCNVCKKDYVDYSNDEMQRIFGG